MSIYVNDDNVSLFIKQIQRHLTVVEIGDLVTYLEQMLYDLNNRDGDVDELQENEDFERADEYYGG